MTTPLHAETDSIAGSGFGICNAGASVEGRMSSAMSDAETCRPGFPGDITGPFEQVLKRFSEANKSLRENVEALGVDVQNAASGYDSCDVSSASNFGSLGPMSSATE